VQRTAIQDDAQFELPLNLGCVIAHEVGHLLLGMNSHSGSGVMQARWDRRQMSQAMWSLLLFTPEQSKRIRAEARARATLQRASVNAASEWTP